MLKLSVAYKQCIGVLIAASLFFIAPLATHAQVVKLPSFQQPSGSSEIVGFNIENTTNSTLSSRYISFGQAFVKGDVPSSATLVAKIGSDSIPVQMDIKNKYPDGSVQFAILTLQAPQLSSGATAKGVLAKGGTAGTALTLASQLSDYNVVVTLSGGITTTIDVGAKLSEALAAGRATYWLQGRNAVQARVDVPVSSSFHIVFDVTAYADGTFTTDAQFRNDYAMQATGGTVNYTATIKQDGATVFNSGALTHHQYQDWRRTFHTSGAPSADVINVQRDIATFRAAGVIPSYNLESGVDGGEVGSKSSVNITPFAAEGITKYMPSTGERDDIGVVPQWHAVWLMTQDDGAARSAQAVGNAAGSVPWHFFDPAKKEYLSLDDYPQLWTDYRGNPKLTQETKDSSWTLDNAHMPSLTYVPYIMTGDRFYLDQINAQAGFGVFVLWPSPRQDGKGIVLNGVDQVRGQTWSFREITNAAWANPDGSAAKAYWNRIVKNNYDYLNNVLVPDLKTQTGEIYGFMEGAYRQNTSNITFAMWQMDFMSNVIALDAARSRSADAVKALSFLANLAVGRFINVDKGVTLHDIVGYDIVVGKTNYFKTWQEFGAANSGSCSNDAYAGYALSAVAAIYNVTGDADALKGYNNFKAYLDSNCPLAPRLLKHEAKFHIVPASNVTPTPIPDPTPTPTPTPKFVTGDRTITLDTVNVRATANGTVLGTQNVGSLGAIIGGPTTTGGYTWWNVNYDGGVDGWSAEDFLAKSTAPTPDPTPTPTPTPGTKQICVGTNCSYSSVQAAFSAATNGSTITITGEWTAGGALSANNVTIKGTGGHLKGGAVQGKGIVVISGTNTTIEGLECSEAAVPDENGACVRFDGTNLTLKNVNFHDNQDGVLTRADAGTILIEDSTFEGNGFNGSGGYAHGIYVNGGNTELIIRGSRFIRSKLGGHEVKSRAAKTTIENSTIATIDGVDSRTIDIPNGGVVVIRNNVIQQGPNSENSNAIGIGSEGVVHSQNSVLLENNYIILERNGTNVMLQTPGMPTPTVRNNTVVGGSNPGGTNTTFYASRSAAGIAAFPYLPPVPGGVTPTPTPTPTATLTASPTSITSGQSTTLTWSSTDATTCTGTNFNTGGAVSGSVAVTLTNNATFSVTCGTATAQTSVTVTAAPTPTFTLGERISLTTGTNVRSTANGTVLGTQPTGALGTLTLGPTTAGGYTWWSVNYDTGTDGYSVQDYMVKSTIPAPTPTPTATLTASPTSITSGQSTTLTWSSTDATTCTGTGFTTTGVSGSVTVSPTSNTTYSVTCTGLGGTVTKTAVVSVTTPTTPPATTTTWTRSPAVSFTRSPRTIAAGQTSLLTWSATRADSCTGTGFETAGAIKGTVTVTPTETTTYTIACTGLSTVTKTALVTVTGTTPTPDPTPTGTVSLFSTSDTPATMTANDSNSVELGVRFKSSVDGTITGLRFYKGPDNTGTHTGTLWSSGGSKLASGTFQNESSSGWQTLTFSSPVTIKAGTTYVASYFAPQGKYSVTYEGLASVKTSGVLSTIGSSNGVYKYGTSSRFPNESYRSTNYWVDVLFSATATTPTPDPTPTPTPTPETLTLGRTSQSGTPDASNSNVINVVRFSTGSQGGSAQSMSVYVASPISSAPNNQFSLAIYSDNSGAPGSLVAKTESGTLSGNAWNTLPISATLAPNTTYWLAYNTNGTANSANNIVATGGSSNQMQWKDQTFGTWPTTFGTVAGKSNTTASIYVTYTSTVTAAAKAAPLASATRFLQAPFTTTLSIGTFSPEVVRLQALLTLLGYFKDTPTGYYGPMTAAAVSAFQADNGLEPVGVVGEKTRRALNVR